MSTNQEIGTEFRPFKGKLDLPSGPEHNVNNINTGNTSQERTGFFVRNRKKIAAAALFLAGAGAAYGVGKGGFENKIAGRAQVAVAPQVPGGNPEVAPIPDQATPEIPLTNLEAGENFREQFLYPMPEETRGILGLDDIPLYDNIETTTDPTIIQKMLDKPFNTLTIVSAREISKGSLEGARGFEQEHQYASVKVSPDGGPNAVQSMEDLNDMVKEKLFGNPNIPKVNGSVQSGAIVFSATHTGGGVHREGIRNSTSLDRKLLDVEGGVKVSFVAIDPAHPRADKKTGLVTHELGAPKSDGSETNEEWYVFKGSIPLVATDYFLDDRPGDLRLDLSKLVQRINMQQ